MAPKREKKSGEKDQSKGTETSVADSAEAPTRLEPAPALASSSSAAAAIAVPPVLIAGTVGDAPPAETAAALMHDGAAAAAGPRKSCTTCKAEIINDDFISPKADFYKCGDCNRTAARINRCLDSAAKEGWKTLPPDVKSRFIAESHDVLGQQLKALITETIERSKTEVHTEEHATDDEWMDVYDLENTYKNKPEILANIKKNAATMECKVRGCIMYAVPKYTSSRKQQQKEEKRQTCEVSTERAVKPTKRALEDKTEPKPKKAAVPKPITEAGLKRLEKQVGFLHMRSHAWEELVKEYPEYTAIIPLRLLQKVELSLTAIQELTARIQLVIAAKIGDIKRIPEEVTAVVTLQDDYFTTVHSLLQNVCSD
jgi:hypothetical protein